MSKLKKTQLIIGSIITAILLVLHFTIGDIELFSINDNLKSIYNINTVNFLILFPIALLTYIFVGYEIYIEAFEGFKEKEIFSENTLTIIATIAAFCVFEFVEALAIVLFFQIGETFEDYAKDKSKKSIESILELKPDYANLLKDEKEIKVAPEEVKVNDIIIVKPGERIPLDGIIYKGNTSLNTSSITGESLPLDVKEGDSILSGTINISSLIYIKVTKEFKESTISRILQLVTESSEKKSKKEKFITKFSKIYTPIVISLAFITAILVPLILGFINNNLSDSSLWINWITTGCTFLVISCPCSLVLSVPLAYFVSLGVASKNKALVKGSVYLEYLNEVDTVFLDKTGTITKGNFEVDKYYLNNNHTQDELFKLASYGEHYSNHPIANAIKKNYLKNIDEKLINNYETIIGKGIKTQLDNKTLLVGNSLLMDDYNIDYSKNNDIGTIIYVAYNNEYIGSLTILDALKEDSLEAIKGLKSLKIKDIIMLTGDNKDIASLISNKIGIKSYSNLLPQDKTRIIEEYKQKGAKTMFIGDGINDAPSITLSDIGVSMGGIGSDAAVEASDIVIMDDKLSTVKKTKKIAKVTSQVALANIIFSLIIKIGMMVFSICNTALNLNLNSLAIWLAIFADVGVTIICVLNSMSLMIRKFK